MTVLKIELIDPRAKKLLKDLAELNLIKIHESGEAEALFSALLAKLRSEKPTLSLEEITHEVEETRLQRTRPNESAH